MNNDKFLVEESDLTLARDICKEIKDDSIRNRAVANALAADIAKNYFSETDVDVESGLHRIAEVLKDIDISDIYIRDSYIDVRLYFNENELSVPTSHFERNLTPIAYMFIKLDSELSSASVTGFVLSESVDTSHSHNGYYGISEDDLVSFYDVDSHLVSKYDDSVPDSFELQMFNYLSGTLEDVDSFYRMLISSRDCRIRLKDAAYVQNLFEVFPSQNNKDSEIDIVVTQDLETDIQENLLLEDSEPTVGLDLADESFDINMDSSPEILDEDISDASDSILQEEITPFDSVDLDSDEMMIEPAEDLMELSKENEDELSPLDIEDNLTVADNLLEENSGISIISDSDSQTNDLDVCTLESLDEEENSLSEPDTSVLTQHDDEVKQIDVLEVEESIISIESGESGTKLLQEGGELASILPPQELVEDHVDEISEQSVDFLDETSADNDIQESYTTKTTPSIDAVENKDSFDNLEHLLDNDGSVVDDEQIVEKSANDDQLGELFRDESTSTEYIDEDINQTVPQKKVGLIPVLGIVVVVGALLYFSYTKFVGNNSVPKEISDSSQEVVQNERNRVDSQDAMPVETIENVEPIRNDIEGNSIEVPAIEQNLDASILVSNLAVSWEVPAGYVSNNTAQRYFNKMGRIIQLNLKAELLLLNKPPITNKIALELVFNKNTNKFEVKEVISSSGERSVDDVIVQTVTKTLNINLKTNTSSFSSISGNPVLIIRL